MEGPPCPEDLPPPRRVTAGPRGLRLPQQTSIGNPQGLYGVYQTSLEITPYPVPTSRIMRVFKDPRHPVRSAPNGPPSAPGWASISQTPPTRFLRITDSPGTS